MLNHHGMGKRLVCNGCGSPSRTFDKANTAEYIRASLRGDGWICVKKSDYCPPCTKKETDKHDPPG